MNIPQETIDDIRNSANIVDVIGHYLQLTKSGKSYRTVCPFHDDHDPSMMISEDKQIYKCFVCGKGGNCFTFVQDYKKVSFPEAVIEVAKIIGKPLNIEYEKPIKKVSQYQRYYDELNTMIEYSNYLLVGSKKGLEAKEYLNNRGIDENIINEFNIGYNPEDAYIYKYLKSKNFTDEEMVKTNICRMSDYGMNDVFARRILFPIHDKDGNPIAFTARDFLGISDSKYINSSETLIYVKGNTLYNYHRAKEACKQFGFVIVVEGVMDVIAFKRAGIANVVATLGTAMSKNQLELLKTLSNDLVLAYDGDRAGQAANLKNGSQALDDGFKVEVIDNETGLDPDEIIGKYSNHALRDMSSKRLSYIDYVFKYYKQNYNLDNYNDRKKMAFDISKLIDKLNDQYDKENYINELYELTKIRKIETRAVKKGYNEKRPILTSYSMDGLTKAEYIILMQMSLNRNAKDIYQKELGCLLDEDNSKLANLIIDEYRKHDRCSLAKLYDETNDDQVRQLIVNLSTMDILPDVFTEDILLGAIEKVKEEIKKRKLEDLKTKINQYQLLDPEKTAEYLNEYTSLLKELGGTKRA